MICLRTHPSEGGHEAGDLSVVLAVHISIVLDKQTNHIEVAPCNQ